VALHGALSRGAAASLVGYPARRRGGIVVRWLFLWMLAACEGPPCTDEGCDADGDGVSLPDDCDDTDAAVGAGASWYPDCDDDGVSADAPVVACDAPAAPPCDAGGTWRGQDEPRGDCDDTNADATDASAWAADCDDDGVTGTPLTSCGEPTDTAVLALCGITADVAPGAVGGDCDDADADVAEETSWYADCDDDGTPSVVSIDACGVPEVPPCDLGGGWYDAAPPVADCDDEDPTAWAETAWWVDCDDDGVYRDTSALSCGAPDAAATTDVCGGPGDWIDVAPGDFDCDDDDAGNTTVSADWRYDCDGDDVLGEPIPVCGNAADYRCPAPLADPFRFEFGGDSSPLDCDDTDNEVFPGAVDAYGDGMDQDCDGDEMPAVIGTRYYVSATRGAAANPGTRERPFVHVEQALSLCHGGDAVYIAEGYFEVGSSARVRCSLIGGYSDDGNWTFDADQYAALFVPPSESSDSAIKLLADGARIDLVGLITSGQYSTVEVYTPTGPTDVYIARSRIGSATLRDVRGTIEQVEFGMGQDGVVLYGSLTDLTFDDVRMIGVEAPTPDQARIQMYFGGVARFRNTEVRNVYAGFHVDEGEMSFEDTTVSAVDVAVSVGADGSAVIVDSTLTASKGLLVDAGRARVVRSRLTGTLGTDTVSSGARVRGGGTLRAVSSVLNGGDGGRNELGVGAMVGPGELEAIGCLLDGGTGPATYGLEVFDGGRVTAVNTAIVTGDGVNEAIHVGTTSVVAPTVSLYNVLLDGAPYVLTRGGSSGPEDLTSPAAVTACGWWSCTEITNAVFGAPVYTADDGTWRLAAGSPGRDQGADPTAYFDDPDAGLDLHGVPRPIGAWDIGPTEQ
jgi:hypothetical protein